MSFYTKQAIIDYFAKNEILPEDYVQEKFKEMDSMCEAAQAAGASCSDDDEARMLSLAMLIPLVEVQTVFDIPKLARTLCVETHRLWHEFLVLTGPEGREIFKVQGDWLGSSQQQRITREPTTASGSPETHKASGLYTGSLDRITPGGTGTISPGSALMQPLKHSNRTKQHFEKKERLLEEGLDALKPYTTDIKSLPDFIRIIPGICNEHGTAMFPCLLVRHVGEETFISIPIDLWTIRLFPAEHCKSDVELEEEHQAYKGLESVLVRRIIQWGSFDEYIFGSESYGSTIETGGLEEEILLTHSDSATPKKIISLPYTHTEADGYVFGKAIRNDNSTRQFSGLKEKRF